MQATVHGKNLKPSYTNSSLLYKIKKCGYFQDAHTQWQHSERFSSYFLHSTIDAPIGSSRVPALPLQDASTSMLSHVSSQFLEICQSAI